MENKTFEVLNKININKKVKTKMGLKYLSWADAWSELLTRYPDAVMTVYTRNIDTTETLTTKADGIERVVTNKSTQEIPYFTDGNTCYVKVGVTINGIEYVEYYPVMGLKNNAIKVDFVTMVDVNKAIQRAFAKACARHGLGLYLYTGEDLPDSGQNDAAQPSNTPVSLDGVRTEVINIITKLQSTPAYTEVVRYIQEIFGNQKISQTTEKDLDKLIAAKSYLSTLIK